MTNAAYFLGAPSKFTDKITIYPPTVREVAANPKFWQCFKLLTISQEEIEDELANKNDNFENLPTPFEFLLINAYYSEEYADLVKEAFQLFVHQDCTLLIDAKQILIGELTDEVVNAKSITDLALINDTNFFDFQNSIRLAIGAEEIEPPDPTEDIRVKRIKAKARYRDKIKAKKGMGLKLVSCLTAICCMGIGLTPLNIGEISYASIDSLMRTYQEKEKYNVDIRSLLAGADAKKVKPKYWIHNYD